MDSFFKRLQGSREGCFFDSGATKVDAAVACHEVRAVELAPGEQFMVSVRDLRRRDVETYVNLQEVSHLKSLNLDATILVRVMISTGSRERHRACGEVRIPLQRLITRCDGALYHTWLTLEAAGLRDSAASIGSLLAGDDGESFEQALMNGPRQLLQPKACISLCKMEDLPQSGNAFLWTPETPNEIRSVHWAPLLRSQQQHVVMCAAQHLQCSQSSQSQAEQHTRSSQREQELEEQASAQTQDLERLQALLAEREGELHQKRSHLQDRDGKFDSKFREQDHRDAKQLAEIARLQAEVSLEVTRGAERIAGMKATVDDQAKEITVLRERRTTHEQRMLDRCAHAEVREAQTALARSRQEVVDATDDLERTRDEANDKIDAANDRIKALRRDLHEVRQDVERLATENHRTGEDNNALSLEREALLEQKDALLKIVEDLHVSCIGAGVSATTQVSLEQRLSGFSVR